MKRAILFVFVYMICVASFSESVRFKQFGTSIAARADLDVRWNAPSDAVPPKIWVYRLLPRNLSPKTISYLMELCSFTEKDKTEQSADGMLFKTPNNSRRLWISFSSGTIDYETVTKYSHTNLIEDVPNEKQALRLTKKLLPKLGISLSDIHKKENSNEPKFICSASDILYFVKPQTITNTLFRAVGFRRAVDGFLFVSVGTGGNFHIEYGERGKIIKTDLSWRNMERDKSYPTLSPERMIKSLREGKAIQGFISMNSAGIDWRTAKTVTVIHARTCYYAGDSLQPSDWLEPYAELDTVVDTGHGDIRVEIDCPVIDE
jgi:hypothetical protein